MESYAKGMGIDNVSYEDSKRIRELWLESYPEMKLHLDPPIDEYWTARNIKDWCNSQGVNLFGDYSEEALRNHLWMEWGKSEDDFETEEEFREFRKALNKKIFYTIKELVRYKAVTILGRVRSNCTYSSSANTVFQGLTATGVKLAMWYLVLAGYKICNMIHDEIIIELDDDENLQYHVKRCEELMLEAMGQIIKRVKIGVESALMYRWDKNADPVYDDEGNLMIWTPETDNTVKESEVEKVDNPILF